MEKAFLSTAVSGRISVTVNHLIKNRGLHSVIICDRYYPNLNENYQVVVDVRNPKKAIDKAVRELEELSKNINVVGYLNMQDDMSFIYKGILEKLCPDHPDIENINVTRDKYNMRCILQARKISQPYFALVNSETALRRVIESCPYPCVSKPLSGTESYLIRKNNSPVELQQSYTELLKVLKDGQHPPTLEQPFLLVEEYLLGKDFHVEGIVDNGHIRLLACHEKLPAFASDNPFSTAISISPPISLSQVDLIRIKESIVQAVSILKIDNTVFNIDLRFDGNQATIVEINPRLGGATIRQTIYELTKLDPVGLQVQLALGEQIDWPDCNSSKTNCLYRIPITKSGMVSKLEGIAAINSSLVVCKFLLNYQVGDYVKLDENKADNHFGYIHVVSNSPQRALQTIKNLIKNLKIEIA